MNESAKINKIKFSKFSWQPALSAIALAIGIFGISETPARSMPSSELVKDSWQVAQVGVRSRVTTPTPLNLRPQTHIPLPTNSRSSDYYRHSEYRHRYGRYDDHGYGHHHRHHHHRHRGTTIIINPATSSYSNYSSQDSYIRIIRK